MPASPAVRIGKWVHVAPTHREKIMLRRRLKKGGECIAFYYCAYWWYAGQKLLLDAEGHRRISAARDTRHAEGRSRTRWCKMLPWSWSWLHAVKWNSKFNGRSSSVTEIDMNILIISISTIIYFIFWIYVLLLFFTIHRCWCRAERMKNEDEDTLLLATPTTANDNSATSWGRQLKQLCPSSSSRPNLSIHCRLLHYLRLLFLLVHRIGSSEQNNTYRQIIITMMTTNKSFQSIMTGVY